MGGNISPSIFNYVCKIRIKVSVYYVFNLYYVFRCIRGSFTLNHIGVLHSSIYTERESQLITVKFCLFTVLVYKKIKSSNLTQKYFGGPLVNYNKMVNKIIYDFGKVTNCPPDLKRSFCSCQLR